MLSNGDVYAWGRNNIGQVGLGYVSTMSNEEDGPHPMTPVHHELGVDLVSLAFTQNVSTALDVNGRVWAWGDNGAGQLGLGTPDPSDDFDDVDRHVPTQLPNFATVVMIARGFDHTLALDDTGQVWAWGSNGFGELGDGGEDDCDFPVQVVGLDDAVSILGASASSYAVRADGTLWA